MGKMSKSIKLNVKPAKKVDKFTERQNWLKPKRAKFKLGLIYRLTNSNCAFPIFGKLINEYRNTASFEIVDFNEVDRQFLKESNYRLIIKKKDAVELCRT
ncbi:hypothetical protein [Enterococcus raffinosus]|uniref:Uncharacterized protein n=1 Tax=Enterococcus raffinosus TaxID=71452 RepID=A0AAW8T917_9ENTE|nr:hypothetical protein [Enterococcus raffinosus]MDT2532102.1 hypothetical protein [Enterococcus raffinosus]MDT2545806.1 hypothetical protein [Enterococcus raffinosus]MDT2579060.1 hypothetical protein [Enterococcus raffinosus]